MKKILVRGAVLLVVGAAAYGGYSVLNSLSGRQTEVATATVRQGDVVIRTFARGELQAIRSVTLTAPNLFGAVQVTRLAPLGSFAREKDLIVEFDDAELKSRLEEKQLEIEQIDEQIKRAQADLAIRNNQDEVDLLRSRYSVRRAELEVKRNELVSPIDAKKNILNLEEARRRLAQLESDIGSRRQQAEAELAVLREQKNKALLELQREQRRLNEVKMLAPMSGLVAVKQNRGAGMMFGMQVPDIREGDEVSPGTPVADILDISELEVVAKIGEIDRANLQEGQEVLIDLDAIANQKFRGKIKSMSGTASANIFSGDPSKKFDVIFSIDMSQLLSVLGAPEAEIKRMLSIAERNRNKAPSGMAAGPSMGGFGGPGMMMARAEGGAQAGFGGGGTQGGGAMGGPTADGQGGEGGGRGNRGGMGGPGGAQMSPEDRQKMRAAMEKALDGKKMEDLTPEERREMFQKIRQQTGGPGGMPGMGGGSPQFSAAEMDRAELPPPPGSDKQLDVLLRPGLLADVEIIVEKIPNAIHIPSQALFEKDGNPVVYVRNGKKFEERLVKPLKQSESTMVISEGLKAGEVIALADPNARPGDKRKEDAPKGGGAPMGMPGAGGARGGRL
jgi:HlyD family secretion protein